MAKGVNKVFLLGNVGKDPEIRSTAGGMTVASFTLATADRKKEGANWVDKHRVAQHRLLPAHRRDRPRLCQERLPALGRRQDTNRSWDDKESGQKQYRTEILVNELTLLGGKSGSSEGGSYSKSNTTSYATNPTSQPDYADTGITDDDIPF